MSWTSAARASAVSWPSLPAVSRHSVLSLAPLPVTIHPSVLRHKLSHQASLSHDTNFCIVTLHLLHPITIPLMYYDTKKKTSSQPSSLSVIIHLGVLQPNKISLPQAKPALVSRYNDCIVTQCSSSNGQ